LAEAAVRHTSPDDRAILADAASSLTLAVGGTLAPNVLPGEADEERSHLGDDTDWPENVS
jgi:hypothetical protein